MFYKEILQLCCSLVKIETIWKCVWHKIKFRTNKPFPEGIWSECIHFQSCFIKLLLLMWLSRFNILTQSIWTIVMNLSFLKSANGLFQPTLSVGALFGAWADSNYWASTCHSHEFTGSLQRITLILYSLFCILI